MPVYTFRHTPGVRTVWRVKLPSGKEYYATTYPDTNFVLVESIKTLRRISDGRVLAAVRAELKAAQ